MKNVGAYTINIGIPGDAAQNMSAIAKLARNKSEEIMKNEKFDILAACTWTGFEQPRKKKRLDHLFVKLMAYIQYKQYHGDMQLLNVG